MSFIVKLFITAITIALLSSTVACASDRERSDLAIQHYPIEVEPLKRHSRLFAWGDDLAMKDSVGFDLVFPWKMSAATSGREGLYAELPADLSDETAFYGLYTESVSLAEVKRALAEKRLRYTNLAHGTRTDLGLYADADHVEVFAAQCELYANRTELGRVVPLDIAVRVRRRVVMELDSKPNLLLLLDVAIPAISDPESGEIIRDKTWLRLTIEESKVPALPPPGALYTWRGSVINAWQVTPDGRQYGLKVQYGDGTWGCAGVIVIPNHSTPRVSRAELHDFSVLDGVPGEFGIWEQGEHPGKKPPPRR